MKLSGLWNSLVHQLCFPKKLRPKKMVIRPATLKDIDYLFDGTDLGFKEGALRYPPVKREIISMINEEVNSIRHNNNLTRLIGKFFLAEQYGLRVGFFHLRYYEYLPNDAEISYIFTHESARNKGVATSMVCEALNQASLDGAVNVFAKILKRSENPNIASFSVFQKLGFELQENEDSFVWTKQILELSISKQSSSPSL